MIVDFRLPIVECPKNEAGLFVINRQSAIGNSKEPAVLHGVMLAVMGPEGEIMN